MKPLSDRILEARDIAVQREGDVRIQEFLRAVTVSHWPSALGSWSDTSAAGRLELSVDCHFRSWNISIGAELVAQLELMTPEGLGRTLAGWVQEAIKQELLLLSNPPRDRASDPTIRAVGGVFTCIYDPGGHIVGTRWGGS